MKRILLALLLVGSFGSVFSFGCGGAEGTSSPPITIPAPVAGLSISTPRPSDGRSEIKGPEIGEAAGATWTVTNSNNNETVTTTADDNGVIDTEIPSEVGDELEFTLTTGDGTTQTGTRTVRNNNVVSSNLVEVTTVSPSQDLGFAHYGNGLDSFIDIYDRTNDFAYQSTMTVTGVGLTHVDFHDGLQEFFLVDSVQDMIVLVNTDASFDGGDTNGDGGVDGRDFIGNITTPVFVRADQDGSYALVGHADDVFSLSIVQDNNGAAPTVAGTLLISHPDGGTSHEMTNMISIDYKNGIPRAAVLSRFANGDTILSYVRINLPGTLTVEGQLNLGNDVFSGRSAFEEVVLFADASQILMTHRDNSTVIHYSTDGSTFTEQGTITVGLDPDSYDPETDVGSGPIGLVYDEAGDRAFVALSNEDAIQELDIESRTVVQTLTTTNGLGLVPTGIAMDNGPSNESPTLMIQNEASGTVSFINPDES